MEVALGMALLGMVMATLFSGFTAGFFTVRMSRENLRATQILLEKTETLRLYSWQQVTNNGYIITNFTDVYDPRTTNGARYTGTIRISPANISADYSNDLKLVTVTVNWKTGGLGRTRELRSYVSRYGMQDYIY